jgi:hypothetical protein
MTIYIENPQTLELLTKDGRWTKNRKDAASYRNSTLAKQFGANSSIGAFNVIGAFPNFPQITNLDDGCGVAAKR